MCTYHGVHPYIPEESVSCVQDAYKFLIMVLNWSIRIKTVLEDLILILIHL